MRTLLILLICMNVFACTSVNRFGSNDAPNDELIRKFNEYAQKRTARIVQMDGQEKKGNELRIASHTLSWKENGTEHTMPLDSIYKANFTDRGKGTVDGMKAGALMGVGMGVIGGLSAKSGDWFNPNEAKSAGGKASLFLINALIGSFAGAIYGIPVGYVLGHTEEYRFNEPPAGISQVILEDVKILKETESEIKIEWRGQTVWFFKSQIEMTKTDGKISVRIKKELYHKKFRN